MYSLYRAWLSMVPCGGLPSAMAPALPLHTPLNLTVPAPSQIPEAPDVNLQVGPTMTHFSAHKAVLAAHSGFFKAALSGHTGLTPISVPTVNVDEFSALLTFMYTGYLDLNLNNIYNIILATHILHMPRALELCRSFLMQHGHHQHQQDHQAEQRVNIIKPIPSRKAAPPTQEIFTPAAFGGLQKSETTVFKAVGGGCVPSASTSKAEEKVDKKATSGKSRKRPDGTRDKIIVDIACCDGPVRFHRVINKNYGVKDTENHDFPINKTPNGSSAEETDVFTCVYCNHTFKSQYCYQKHARRHLYPVEGATNVQQAEPKREVRLLDMNVQYYPCKTCGSKFPSYYFVHKHRKLCHAEEVADKDNKNNVIEVENAQGVVEGRENDSSCSAIDVEAINNDQEEAT